MKIGIDARFYGTKHRGIGRYVQKLVDGLVEHDQQNEYVIFLMSDNFELFKTKNRNVKKVLYNVRWYTLKEQLLGSCIIGREKVDLMHFPHFNVPLFYQRPFIVTVHDLIIKHFPDSRATTLPFWKYRLKLLCFDWVLRRAIQKSKELIVPSKNVKDDILRQYPVNPKKIKVIYEGYFLEAEHYATTVSRFNISKPFLLYVGSAYPHKNLSALIKVFKKINQNKKFQLVLVGEVDTFYRRLVIEAAGDADIIFTGYISEGELSGLYQKALVYVFPSLYEGFGLPPLEAQAHRLPVIASDRASIPEVLGHSAMYFNPDDLKEMQKKILFVVENQSLREELIQLGLKNIRRFSWLKTVEETMLLYRR